MLVLCSENAELFCQSSIKSLDKSITLWVQRCRLGFFGLGFFIPTHGLKHS